MAKRIVLSAALTMAAPLSAIADDAWYRLIVADQTVPSVLIVVLGETATSHGERDLIDLSSAVWLYPGPDVRHVWAIQRDAGTDHVIGSVRVNEDHGDDMAMVLQVPALTGEIQSEQAGATQSYRMERSVVRPMMDVAVTWIGISDPAAGQVVIVDSNAVDVLGHLDVGHVPRSLMSMETDANHAS